MQGTTTAGAAAAITHQIHKITDVPLSISLNSGGDWHSAGSWTYLDPLSISSISPKRGSSQDNTTVNMRLDRFLQLEEETSNLLPYCEFIINAAVPVYDTVRVSALRMQNWEEGSQFNCTVGPPLTAMTAGPIDIKLVLLKYHDNGSLKVATTTTIGQQQHQFIIVPPLEVFGYSITTAAPSAYDGNSDEAGNNNKRRQWIRVSGRGFLDVPEFACRWSVAPFSGDTEFFPAVAVYVSGEVALCSIAEEWLWSMASMGRSLYLGVTVNGQGFYGENISINFINLLEVYPSHGLTLGDHTVKVTAEGIDDDNSLILQQQSEEEFTDLQTMLTPHLDCKWTLPDGSKSATKAQNITIGISSFLTWYCLVPTPLQSGNGSLEVESIPSLPPMMNEMDGESPSSHLLLSTRALGFSFVDTPRVLNVVPSHILYSGGAILRLSGLNFDYYYLNGYGHMSSPHCIFKIGSKIIMSEAIIESPFTAICLSPEARLFVENEDLTVSISATLSLGSKEWNLGGIETSSIPISIHPPPIIQSIKRQRNLVTIHGSGFILSSSLSCTFGDVSVQAISASTEGLQCFAPEDSHPGPGMFWEDRTMLRYRDAKGGVSIYQLHCEGVMLRLGQWISSKNQ